MGLCTLKLMFRIIFTAMEWVGPNDPERFVGITLGPGKMIQVLNESGTRRFREIDLSRQEELIFCLSSDRKRQYISIQNDKEYDLVIKFNDEEQRSAFISDLHHWLQRPDVEIRGKKDERREKTLLRLAVTKEDRQKKLEKFLRSAFAQVCLTYTDNFSKTSNMLS